MLSSDDSYIKYLISYHICLTFKIRISIVKPHIIFCTMELLSLPSLKTDLIIILLFVDLCPAFYNLLLSISAIPSCDAAKLFLIKFVCYLSQIGQIKRNIYQSCKLPENFASITQTDRGNMKPSWPPCCSALS